MLPSRQSAVPSPRSCPNRSCPPASRNLVIRILAFFFLRSGCPGVCPAVPRFAALRQGALALNQTDARRLGIPLLGFIGKRHEGASPRVLEEQGARARRSGLTEPAPINAEGVHEGSA